MTFYIAVFLASIIILVACVIDFAVGSTVREIRDELKKLNGTMEKLTDANKEEKTQV